MSLCAFQTGIVFLLPTKFLERHLIFVERHLKNKMLIVGQRYRIVSPCKFSRDFSIQRRYINSAIFLERSTFRSRLSCEVLGRRNLKRNVSKALRMWMKAVSITLQPSFPKEKDLNLKNSLWNKRFLQLSTTARGFRDMNYQCPLKLICFTIDQSSWYFKDFSQMLQKIWTLGLKWLPVVDVSTFCFE